MITVSVDKDNGIDSNKAKPSIKDTGYIRSTWSVRWAAHLVRLMPIVACLVAFCDIVLAKPGDNALLIISDSMRVNLVKKATAGFQSHYPTSERLPSPKNNLTFHAVWCACHAHYKSLPLYSMSRPLLSPRIILSLMQPPAVRQDIGYLLANLPQKQNIHHTVEAIGSAKVIFFVCDATKVVASDGLLEIFRRTPQIARFMSCFAR